MSEILRIENLTTGYNAHTVLRDVSLSMQKGEVLAVIGQNGSGKSTLLKTIARIITDNSGTIIIHGMRMNDLQPWQLRDHGVAYSMQTGMIFPTLTVREHFTLVLRSIPESDRASMRESCFIHFPELKDLIDKRAGNLSGGQRQMLGFAMLLSQQAQVWLLDEPTAGLGPSAVERAVQFLLKMKSQEQTMILVEHNYRVAFELANHVAIVKDGLVLDRFSRPVFQEAGFLEKHLYR